MARTMNTNQTMHIEVVDSNQDLTIQCATIQNLFESSPVNIKNGDENHTMSPLIEDEIRKVRGTIIDNKTKQVVHRGTFFPYEYTEQQREECIEKMADLNHKFEDIEVQCSYEGTIIRIFYYKKWYISTHRKLDSGRSKWASNDSFKTLFEKGLKESYNITLNDLFTRLNLRCQYTFMVMADENTRFVCSTNILPKKVYFVESNDPTAYYLNMDKLPRPSQTIKSVNEAFDYIQGMAYPFTHQGLLLVHSSGSQYRIVSDEYAKLFRVRNNEQSIPYRYIQLRCQNNHLMIDLLQQLFPEYIQTFDSYEKCVSKLVDIIYHEYNKRKSRTLLPVDLTMVQQIDQKLYLFIKNRLLGAKGPEVTPARIWDLLWMEEPSNLNHMIRMVKFNHKKDEQNLILDMAKINLTPDQPIPNDIKMAPKKKKVKYIPMRIEFNCRKRLF